MKPRQEQKAVDCMMDLVLNFFKSGELGAGICVGTLAILKACL